jgi:hypothetical protein
MDETKLEKVSKRLYHQPYKNGEPIKWVKDLSYLFLTLTDIRVDLTLDIERPEPSFSLLPKDVEKGIEDDQKAEQENTTTSGEEEAEGEYSERFGWRIVATGHLDDSIGIIRKDGTVTGHTEHFDSVEVTLRPVSDSAKEKVYGSLLYSDAKYEKRVDPYLRLGLFVPETRLEKLCYEIVSGHLSALQVQVDVDVFQSEARSWAWEPPMPRRLYIEEDQIYNRAYLSWLAASRFVTSGASGAAEVPDNPRALFKRKGFSEQKVNFIGKRLLQIEDRFKTTLKELRNVILVLAGIYLAWKFLAWIFG